MKKKSYDDHLLNDHNENTAILKVEKKQHRNDSIEWVIGALLVTFFTILAVGRITLIGQFLDDVLFTFAFGWFKYLLYLVCLVLGVTIFIGVRIKLKSRVCWIIISFVILSCWLVSSVLLIYQYANGQIAFFNKTVFLDVINNYLAHWQDASIFNANPSHPITFIGFNGSWITLYAGGGIIGNFLAGIFSYTTIFGSLIFCLLTFLLWGSWVTTGTVWGLFLPKAQRQQQEFRVLRLSANRRQKQNIYQSFNIPDEELFSARQVMHTTEASDITIQMPSYTALHDQRLIDDLIADDFVGKKKGKQNYVRFDEQETMQSRMPADKFNDYNPTPPQRTPKVSPTPDQYIQPRNRQNNNYLNKNIDDLPVYSFAYGKDVNIDAARDKLNSETNITPFGKINRNLNPTKVKQTSFYDDHVQVDDFNVAEPQDYNQFDSNVLNDDGIYHRQSNQPIFNEPAPYQTEYYPSYEPPLMSGNNFNMPPQQRRASKPKTIEVNKKLSQAAPRRSSFNNPHYKLPNLGLLNPKEDNRRNNERNKTSAQKKAVKINEVFHQFNIAASVQGVNIGPTITKFEVQMQPGVKVNKIMNLENDLKYALATQNVRIEAPIQGKSAVGIEIANEISSKVTLREIMERVPLEKQNKKLLVGIGRSVNGEIIFVELDKMPHLLVAGSTGSGKSVCINTILSSLLLRTKPSEVKLLLIDPKQVELAVYNNLPHLLAPVISDTKFANAALKKVIAEMERRYSMLSERGVRNIETFNNKVSPKERLPYIVVVIDELGDLMMTAGKDIEDSIMRITQLARAAGIYMVIATQRPSTDVITGVIKTNIPSRVSFSVASSIDSRTILDQGGAEKLIGYGDMLYAPAGQNIPTRAQGAFISDDEIQRLVDFCHAQQEPDFDEEFINIENSNEVGGGNEGEDIDPMYNEIKRFVILNQKASTSLIQRKFSIGYNRASRLIDALEDNGVIGPQNGAKTRDVYIQSIDLDDNDFSSGGQW
ncbi:DNA translocase FtsK [Spiroplasma poulsonii]|uniref:DNA translocase FtsK n=1 Tax=Spiroplasma poulsonii TaxID=2138 RepID=A0A3S0ZXQ0_9MOLU|nr:DNA translocase FtsK [Spiroplasma poulsonii]MBW3058061.1 DNA translocase FtsK [Spiroplasma poulsonii]RUP78176.1 DNA translocase FtsK [Spiroplasma poulsonii]